MIYDITIYVWREVLIRNIAGYIDLSKRRVSSEDILKCEDRYNKSKLSHSLLRHTAEKTETPIVELYEKIGWPLSKKYGHMLDAFKLSITNPNVVSVAHRGN
jgi:translation initiation factor 2 subunit 1